MCKLSIFRNNPGYEIGKNESLLSTESYQIESNRPIKKENFY